MHRPRSLRVWTDRNVRPTSISCLTISSVRAKPTDTVNAKRGDGNIPLLHVASRFPLMTSMRSFLLAMSCVFLSATTTRSDEAIEHSGKKHPGKLVHESGVWTFQSADGKSIPMAKIARVRFEDD